MNDNTADAKSPIGYLNDDCLNHIFQFLPFPDRTRIERVYKRWLTVSQQTWSLYSRSNPCLVFGSDTGNFPTSHKYISWNENNNNQVIERILQHRGPYLQEISFSSNCRGKLGPGVLKTVATFCPQIKRLNTKNVYVDGSDLEVLAEKCSTIQALTLDDCDCEDSQIQLLIWRNKGLRHLSISRINKFIGSYLKDLNQDVLESLEVKHCEYFRLTSDMVEPFAASLTELKLWGYNDLCTILHVAKLTNLRRLELLLWPYLDEQVMACIAHYCKQIEYVKLGLLYDYSINYNEITPILDLPCLKTLVIKGKVEITETLFTNKPMSNLEHLVLPCNDMAEASHLSLINRLSALRSLEVCNCIIISQSEWKLIENERGVQISTRSCLLSTNQLTNPRIL